MFRNLTIYQTTVAPQELLTRLPEALAAKQFVGIGEHDQVAKGWVPPVGRDFVYGANGGHWFRLRTDTKVVPASWLRDALAARRARATFEENEFTKTDEQIYRDDLVAQVLPHIPPEIAYSNAYLDPELGMLFVDRVGDDADALISQLGVALGGKAPLKLLEASEDPCNAFTAWLREPDLLNDHFDLGESCDFKHAGESGGCGIINVKRETIDSEELVALLDAGRQVCAIAVEHGNGKFRLRADVGIRSLELAEHIEAEAFDPDVGDVTEPYRFAALVPAVREIMHDLTVVLGEWPEQLYLDLTDTEAADG